MPCTILVVFVLMRGSSGRRVVNEGISAAANGRKVFCNVSGHLQDPGTGMPHESARHLKEPPAHRGDPVPLPTLTQGGVFEQNKEVMGDDADSEEGGIGTFLTTRLLSMPKPILSSLMPFSECSPRWRYQISTSAVLPLRLLAMTW